MIKNAKPFGNYIDPSTKRKRKIFTGIDNATGKAVYFVENTGGRKIIPQGDFFNKWRKSPSR